MFELKLGEVIQYPVFCVSKINDMVVITTKKIASRFFEAATLEEYQLKEYNYKEHKLKSIDYVINTKVNNTFKLSDVTIEAIPGSDAVRLSVNEFHEELKIKDISDIFSVDYAETNKVVFVTRNPTDRFYTGFMEWVDSEFGKYNNNSELRGHKSQEEIDSVLNEYIGKVDYNVFSDQHMSLWNTFLINFLITNDIKHHVKIVNLNNSSHMQLFKKDYMFGQPSNKSYVDKWLSAHTNETFVKELNNRFKFYFDLEIDSYNKLLNVNYK